jgi:predicted flap endonuclease-1-like 5' DNA nuclease
MLNPAHLLEIAMLLLAAFLGGATIGSLARLLVQRLVRPKVAPSAAIAASAAPAPPDLAPQVAEAPALVAAPVIGEVVRTPAPTAPADIPAPDFTEALLALAGDKPGAASTAINIPRIAPLPGVPVAKPAEPMGPARVAGATTSGRAIAHPRTAVTPTLAPVAMGASAEVIPFPVEKAVVEPEQGDPAGATPPLERDEVEVVAASAADMATDAASADVPETMQLPAGIEDIIADVAQREPLDAPAAADMAHGDSAGLAAQSLAIEVSQSQDSPAEDSGPSEAVEAGGPDADENAAPAVAAATPDLAVEDDEAAAMRAIEGNWSPRRASSAKARRVELPEIAADEAVLASGAAVSSAAMAVKLAVSAGSDEPPGKPDGLAGPRLGAKDDLTHVIGILPIIETALNRLGLYHFDQIADLSDENAGWIEAHLGIAGRIGREHWREQAREIAAAMASAKKAAGS